jgi:hypothetical protein
VLSIEALINQVPSRENVILGAVFYHLFCSSKSNSIWELAPTSEAIEYPVTRSDIKTNHHKYRRPAIP